MKDVKYLLIILILSVSSVCFSQEEPELRSPHDDDYEIDELNIVHKGRETFTAAEIKSNISTGSTNYFNPEEFATDLLRIKKFYFDRGFFNATVDTSSKINKKDQEISVTFTIREGKRAYVNYVDYIGLDSANKEALDLIYKNEPTVAPGKPYTKETVSLEVIRVLSILSSKGYPFAAKKDVEIEKLASRDTSEAVNVKLEFTTGEIYKFGESKIIIAKSKYDFKESDVRREIQYKEGDRYDKDLILRTENRIASIPLIETSKFEISYIDSVNKTLDYLIKISLRNKYELTPEILAYDIDNKFYGGIGLAFTDRYFFGGGRTFNTSIRGLANSLKNNRVEFLAQVSQPYLFNNENISGSDRIGSLYDIDEEFKIFEVNNTISISYEFKPYTYFRRLIFDWQIRNRNIDSRLPLPLSNGRDTAGPFSRNIFLSDVGFSTLHDNTDNLTFPTTGFFQSLGMQESGALGTLIEKLFGTFTFKYYKLTILNKLYFNFSDAKQSTSVLALKFLGGYIHEYGENSINVNGLDVTSDVFPFDIKYTAGGSVSNRGWKSRTLGYVTDQEIGGDFLLEGSIEHRVRPFINSDGLKKDLGFVTFLDYGNVWSDIKKARADQIALSIGAGLRYFTIVGAVRFDVGFKLYDPNPGPVGGAKWLWEKGGHFNDKYNFQFGIGNTF